MIVCNSKNKHNRNNNNHKKTTTYIIIIIIIMIMNILLLIISKGLLGQFAPNPVAHCHQLGPCAQSLLIFCQTGLCLLQILTVSAPFDE